MEVKDWWRDGRRGRRIIAGRCDERGMKGEPEEEVGDGGVIEEARDGVGGEVVVGSVTPPFLQRGGGIAGRGGKAGEAARAGAFARCHGDEHPSDREEKGKEKG